MRSPTDISSLLRYVYLTDIKLNKDNSSTPQIFIFWVPLRYSYSFFFRCKTSKLAPCHGNRAPGKVSDSGGSVVAPIRIYQHHAAGGVVACGGGGDTGIICLRQGKTICHYGTSGNGRGGDRAVSCSDRGGSIQRIIDGSQASFIYRTCNFFRNNPCTDFKKMLFMNIWINYFSSLFFGGYPPMLWGPQMILKTHFMNKFVK